MVWNAPDLEVGDGVYPVWRCVLRVNLVWRGVLRRTWFGGVLGVVENEHVAGGGLGGDDAGVLGHVPGPVHLSLMVNLNLNLNLPAH